MNATPFADPDAGVVGVGVGVALGAVVGVAVAAGGAVGVAVGAGFGVPGAIVGDDRGAGVGAPGAIVGDDRGAGVGVGDAATGRGGATLGVTLEPPPPQAVRALVMSKAAGRTKRSVRMRKVVSNV